MAKRSCNCYCCQRNTSTLHYRFMETSTSSESIDLREELSLLREVVSVIAEGHCSISIAPLLCKKTQDKIKEKVWKN